MKLIVGLGNPGFLYARNRHNVGYMCLNNLAKTQKIRFDKTQGHARTGIGMIAGRRTILARPQTYMNSSGDAVSRLVKRYDVAPTDLIVIHDDLDLPTGKIRIREGGGSGGHKGIDSIITHINTPDFYRIRMGIGRPIQAEATTRERESAVIDYVLSDFTRDEKKLINEAIPTVSQAIVCLLAEGIIIAMNKYN